MHIYSAARFTPCCPPSPTNPLTRNVTTNSSIFFTSYLMPSYRFLSASFFKSNNWKDACKCPRKAAIWTGVVKSEAMVRVMAYRDYQCNERHVPG